MNLQPPTWIAFAGHTRIALGAPKEAATKVKYFVDAHPELPVLIFDALSSQPVEIDLRGSLADVLTRLPDEPTPIAPSAVTTEAPRGPGRPRLGVVAREVTLLPRHWDWLSTQPGGASVALRKLVELAQRTSADADRRRSAAESAYRFMHAMAGDTPGFEEATRALFAGDLVRLQSAVAHWPRDVRAHVQALADGAPPVTAEPGI